MSLDTAKDRTQESSGGDWPFPLPERSTRSTEQSVALQRKVLQRARQSPPADVFGQAADHGQVYRWGVGAACDGPIRTLWDVLSRLAVDGKPSKKKLAGVDLVQSAESMVDALNSGVVIPMDAAGATVWAAAMPALIDRLHHSLWWDVLSSLQYFRESVTRREAADRPMYLMAAGELGLTLAWRLADLPSCRRLGKSSVDCVAQWCKQEYESVASAITDPLSARLVFASLMRCKHLINATTNRKFKKQYKRVAADLATWIAALTIHTGSTAFSGASRADVSDDSRAGGLMDQAVSCDPESLKPAVDAALGKRQTNGRLAWEISLPESFQHCEDAKVAVMMPEWDVRRGRVHVDYSAKQMAIEMFAGKPVVLSGECQTAIEVDGQPQRAIDNWESTCDFSDDDVHYLELEQPWSGGIVLQRQIMVVRDDRCVLFADSVLPELSSPGPSTDGQIRYSNRIPMAELMQLDDEEETREAFFSDGRRRGLVMPLAAPEWRVGAGSVELQMTADAHLLLTATGRDRLFAPLWFDFSRGRFDRKRTWRKLTVAEDLKIVSDSDAVGFRIQVGSEQWMLYRSLGQTINRSVLGKHLVAEFFAARFHASDGTLEELVTVDDGDDD